VTVSIEWIHCVQEVGTNAFRSFEEFFERRRVLGKIDEELRMEYVAGIMKTYLCKCILRRMKEAAAEVRGLP
jgi:hypothetical protein